MEFLNCPPSVISHLGMPFIEDHSTRALATGIVSGAFVGMIFVSFENLSMMTVELPTIGCFSLLHPNIIMWELDKDDLHPSEENE